MKTRPSRSKVIWLCSALLAATAFVPLVGLYESTLAPKYSDHGTDFGLEGKPVRVIFSFTPKKLAPGDSLDVNIHLGNLPGAAPNVLPPGLANESGGELAGTLVAPDDCKVNPPAEIVWPTAGVSLEEMEWHWIVDCSTEGRKALSDTLKFKSNGHVAASNSSDVVAYNGNLSIAVSKPLTQVVLGFLSAALLAISGVLVSSMLRGAKGS